MRAAMAYDFDAEMRAVDTRTARRLLRAALYWHSFFDHQSPGFSAAHHALRAEINARTVNAYARQAAMFARRAGGELESWLAGDAGDAMAVPEIRAAFVKAWHDATDEDTLP